MSSFKTNKIISKPNLQPVNSPTTSEQSPATTIDQHAQMDRIPTLESFLPPSNLTDIESFDQNHDVSPKSRRTESSSIYEDPGDSTYQYLQQQLPQQPASIISKNSSSEAIPVSIKLSQLPNNSSSSLFINNRTRQQNSPSVNSQRGNSKSPSKSSHFSSKDEPIIENLKPSLESSSSSTHSLESPITPLVRKTKSSSQSIQQQQQQQKTPSSSMVSPGFLIMQQESSHSPHQPSPALSHLSVSTFGHKKRESMLSTYSGAVEYDAVPMTVKRSSSSKIKYVGNASQMNANNNYNNMVSSRTHHRKKSSLSSTTSNKYSDHNTVSDTKLVETSQLLAGDSSNSNNSKHNRSYFDDDDDEEEEDDSSILMGKLPTRSSKEDELKAQQPDKTVTTNIEGSIPARSPRRPASVMSPNFSSIDMINSSSISNNTTGSKDKSRRKSYVEDNKRRSIQINDGLEKLMLDATSFTSQDENDEGKQEGEEKVEHDNTKFIKDVTPNHLNIHRKNGTDEYNEDDDITPKFDPALMTGLHDGVDIDELDNNVPISSRNSSYELWSRHESKRKSPIKPLNLPPRPTKDNITKARTISNNLQQQHLREQYETPDGNPDNININEGEEIMPSKNNLVDDEEYEQRGTTNNHIEDNDDDDDDGFYDITGEPVTVQPPLVRARSVKNSIKRPGRHTKSSKDNQISGDTERHHNSKKHRGRGSGGGNKKHHSQRGKNGLKPFSYTTLISLLESMNGTIIGEEFNQLNIPIKEKQLIEKIIDSLSRLTSDMILDQQRYEIGIDRLEKCLRVLEGFM